MKQLRLFDDIGDENEEDLQQKVELYGQAVIWGTDWTTETIVNQLLKGNIDINPKFQRREAWSNKAKSEFIESLILGLPIPQIILAEKKGQKGKYIVIDGKQRLLSIRRFFVEEENDGFEPLILNQLNILTDLNGKTYVELKDIANYNSIITQLQNQTIRTSVIRNWPDESFLYTIFLRLNSGSLKLSPQELRQALHPGNFIDFADQFASESNAIKSTLGIESPDYRMRDVEIVIRFFNFKYFIEEYDGNLKKSFDRTVEKLNDIWNTKSEKIKEDASRLEKSIDLTNEIFGEKEAFSKWKDGKFHGNFNRAIFDIMTYYFSNDKILEAAKEKKEEICNSFKELCENDDEFLSSFEHTTKSLLNTNKRFNTWGIELTKVLNIPIQVPYLINSRLKLKK